MFDFIPVHISHAKCMGKSWTHYTTYSVPCSVILVYEEYEILTFLENIPKI